MKHTNAIFIDRGRTPQFTLLGKALVTLVILFIAWSIWAWVKVVQAAKQEEIRILTDPSAPLSQEILTYENPN
jgi:hypothetical protein